MIIIKEPKYTYCIYYCICKLDQKKFSIAMNRLKIIRCFYYIKFGSNGGLKRGTIVVFIMNDNMYLMFFFFFFGAKENIYYLL